MTQTLIHLLYDEYMSNGGHFQSSEADYMFRQAFSEDYDESTTDIFNRLITNK
jgi:hypothetical protein